MTYLFIYYSLTIYHYFCILFTITSFFIYFYLLHLLFLSSLLSIYTIFTFIQSYIFTICYLFIYFYSLVYLFFYIPTICPINTLLSTVYHQIF